MVARSEKILIMLTLSFPKPSTAVYPRLRFAELNNMRRQTEFNRKAFTDHVRAQPYNTENEHVLVGLLQQLSINAEWDLQYVVSYAKFQAYSLCTMFKITSLHRVGQALTNGFYRENVREHWCLIENTKTYTDTVTLEDLRPVIPLTSTVTKHSYCHPLDRSTQVSTPINNLAVIGVDIVELAVGWWLYQRLQRDRDTGVHAYVAQYPLYYAQLIHNQMAILNVLYEHVVHNRPLKDLITTDSTVFTTADEGKKLTEYVQFLVKFYAGRRIENFEHFLSMVDSIYAAPFYNYVRAGKNALFSQTAWVWEPALMKLYSIYLTFCNAGHYSAEDVVSVVIRSHRRRVENFQRVSETHFKGWFIELADEVNALAMANG